MGSDDMIHALQPLQQLEALTITQCQAVTDAGIAHLTAFTRLEYLDLQQTHSITDAMWPHLAQMTSLRDVYLTNSQRVTLDGVTGYCALVAVSYRAAHAARIAAAPHQIHPPPSLSLLCLCPRPPETDVDALHAYQQLMGPLPRPYPMGSCSLATI